MKLSLGILAVTASALAAGGVLLACASDDAESPQTGGGAAPSDGGAPDGPARPDDAGADATRPDAAVPRPPFDAAAPDIVCDATPCMKTLVAGPRTYCATDDTGLVRCWGDPSPLGAFVDGGDPNAGAIPVSLTGIGPVRDLGIASNDTCVAGDDGGVRCFGSSSPTPQAVPSVSGAKTLGIGDDRRCAVTTTGALSCWGDNYWTGTGPSTTSLAEPVVDVTLRFTIGFALGDQGTLYSWGTERNMLGRTSAISPDLTPAPVVGLPPAIQMAASDSHVCALAADGRLFCWGRADSGALGLGYVRPESFPVEVPFPGPAWPTQVAAAQTHSCARMSDGTLTCWASGNWSGELGNASLTGVFQPETVTSVKKKVARVAIGMSSSCVLLVDGTVECWGDNSSGQLGRRTRDGLRHPDPAVVVFP